MAANADSVVVELIAKVDQFDQPVKQSASKFDQSMNQIAASATKAEAAVGRSAASTGDAFAVTVRQGAAASTALRGVATAGAVLGGVLETLSGVGIALLIASLVEMVLKTKSANSELDDMVAKLKENHDKAVLAGQAQQMYAQTVTGSIDVMAKLTAEIDKQNLSLQDNIDLQKAAIAGALANVSTNISKVSSDLAAAVAEMKRAQAEINQFQSASLDPNVSPDVAASYSGAQHDFAAARQRVADLTAQLVGLNKAANDGAKALHAVALPLIERNAKDAVDPIAAINHQFDDMAVKAKHAGTYTQDFATNLEKQRKAALDAAKANEQLGKSLGFSGKQIDFGEAASIARGGGLQVNSGPRSYADQKRLYDAWVAQGRPKDNPVAPPGTSAHEGAKGRWALDIQLEPGVTAGKIKKLYADQGVDVNVFPERGHLHVSGSRSQAAAGENAAARAAQQQDQQQVRDANLLAGLNQRYAQALAALTAGTEESTQARKDAIDKERDAEDQRIAGQLKLNQIDGATAKEATRINDATADLAKQLIDRAEAERQFRLGEEKRQRDLTLAEGLNQNQQDVLQGQEALAKTQAERRTIELRILDLAFQEEALREKAVIAARDALAAVLAKQAPDKISDADRRNLEDLNAQASVAQDRLNSAPGRYATSAAGIFQSTANPIEAFLNSVPQSADDINEAFQSIAANGLNSFASGIADAAVNFKSLGQTAMSILHQIEQQLIEMAIKQLFAKALGGLGGGGIFSGGASLAGMSDFSSIGSGLNFGTTFAGGGSVSGPGSSTSDSIPAMLSDGEFVMSAGAVKRIGVANLEALNSGGVGMFADGGLVRRVSPSNSRALSAGSGSDQGKGDIFINVDARDAVLAQTVQGWIAEGMTRAAQGGSALARQKLFHDAIHRLD